MKYTNEIDWFKVANALIDKASKKQDEMKSIRDPLTKTIMLELATLELDLAEAIYKGLAKNV